MIDIRKLNKPTDSWRRLYLSKPPAISIYMERTIEGMAPIIRFKFVSKSDVCGLKMGQVADQAWPGNVKMSNVMETTLYF